MPVLVTVLINVTSTMIICFQPRPHERPLRLGVDVGHGQDPVRSFAGRQRKVFGLQDRQRILPQRAQGRRVHRQRQL